MQEKAEWDVDVGFEGVGAFLQAQGCKAVGCGEDVEAKDKGGQEGGKGQELDGEEDDGCGKGK